MSEDAPINLTLTLRDVQIVLAGLGEIPAKHSMAVIARVKGQAEDQVRKANAPEPGHE
jgi:hypothetical protein